MPPTAILTPEIPSEAEAVLAKETKEILAPRIGNFRAKCSNDVHEEWISNLLEKRPDLTMPQLERTR